MDLIVENAEKRRKLFHSPSSSDALDSLQSLLETYVLRDKLPPPNNVVEHLTRWFHIITSDPNKLRTLRQWVMPSPDVRGEHQYESDGSASSLSLVSSSSPSPESRCDAYEEKRDKSAAGSPKEISATRGDHQALLQQLLQHQQQQFAIIQQLQQASSKVPLAKIVLDAKSAAPGGILLISLKGNRWHPYSSSCTCSCGFTSDGSTITSSRINGGAEGEFRFIVPLINTSSHIVVHLSLCTSPDAPIVCMEPFNIIAGTHSDEDSEESTEVAVDDDDDDDDAGASPSRNFNSTSALSSPKQLLMIRERMLEIAQNPPQPSAPTISIVQQPSVKVVWKNRRVEVPYRLRVSGSDEFHPSKLAALAVIADHKGRLQTDAAENIMEDFSASGLATFNNLRMSKGTWGKEWTISFAVVVKASLSGKPVVLATSSSCSIIVKTRKNPQIRHSGGISRSESPPSPVFVERKSDQGIKRNRVEDLLDNSTASPPSRVRSTPTDMNNSPNVNTTSHSEDMFSLLAAAEIKQQEQVHTPLPPIQTALQNLQLPDKLPVYNGNDNNRGNNSNSNIQTIINHIDDIKSRYQPRLSVIEQPPLKKDQRILSVKKGKPFRSAFRVQLGSSVSGQQLSPEQFSCVVVVRNDKGEEVAVKNNEVLFDWNGVASFPGLMVMKGTWGKPVNLTFEARWANRRFANSADGGSTWPSAKLFVVTETSPVQLMCYTKDKKI